MPMQPHLRALGALALALACAALAGCALPAPTAPDPEATAARLAALPAASVLIVGEQHDAPDHHRIERELVQQLAAQGRLAALALEMAERGRDTRALPATAADAEVQRALGWNDKAWPWASYGPVAMAAVRAGVPVLGANLPREQMRTAMADASLDGQLPGPALKAQQQAIRIGHCNRLPESQITPMTRIQIARDRAMADTLAAAARPGQVAVLVAGAGHADRALGVPQHLPRGLDAVAVKLQAGETAAPAERFDRVWPTPPLPARDYCADLG